MKVSESQFKRYQKVQSSGRVNMFEPNARILACLDKETFMAIAKNYEELSNKYGGISDE